MENYYLTLTPEYVERRKGQDEKGRFRKGHRPWNKDKSVKIAGSEKGHFKQGHTPPNSKHDGAISIRRSKGVPYKHIRVSKGEWVLLHRYTWEQANGSIPPRHVVRFLDGDTLNCELSNLECVSMQENLKRNQDREKAAKSLKKRWDTDKIRVKYGLKQETKFKVK